MANIIGRFYFKKTKSGNLIGEFSNNELHKNYTESAVWKEGEDKNQFEGKYITCWFEEADKEAVKMDLCIISIKTDSFSLKWTDDGIDKFYGEGFIVDDILIGDYINFDSI